MSNSLQDQMLKAGLISEQQLEKVRDPEPRYKPRRGGGAGAQGGGGSSAKRRGGGRSGGAPQQRRGQQGGGQQGGGQQGGGQQRGSKPQPSGAQAGGRDGASGSAAGAAPRKRRRRGGRGHQAAAAAPAAPTVDVQKLRSDQQRSRELLRDTRLAGESAQARRKREARMKLEALLTEVRLNEEGAPTAFYFTRGKRIRRVFVTEEQRKGVVSGELALAAVGADVHIVAAEARERIIALAPDAYFHTGDSEAAPDAASDSDYEGFEVPDDLVW